MDEIIDGYDILHWKNVAPFIYTPFVPLIVTSVINYGLSDEVLKTISEGDYDKK